MNVITTPSPDFMLEEEITLFSDSVGKWIDEHAPPEKVQQWIADSSVPRQLWNDAGDAGLLTLAGAPTSRQAISHWLTGESKPDPRRWATLLEVLEVDARDRSRWLDALLLDHDVREAGATDDDSDTAGA